MSNFYVNWPNHFMYFYRVYTRPKPWTLVIFLGKLIFLNLFLDWWDSKTARPHFTRVRRPPPRAIFRQSTTLHHNFRQLHISCGCPIVPPREHSTSFDPSPPDGVAGEKSLPHWLWCPTLTLWMDLKRLEKDLLSRSSTFL